MSNTKIKYEWDDIGTLDIDVHGNEFATVRYGPSDQFVQETLSKLTKTAGNQNKIENHTHTNPDIKSSQNGSKCPTIDIADRRSYGDRSPRSLFSDLSRMARFNMRKGNWDMLATNYIRMAELLHTEAKHFDELKCLILAFHLRLSGATEPSVADDTLVALSKEAAKMCRMSKNDVVSLYKEEVGDGITPTHLYSIDEACRIYCTIWQSMW